MRTSVRILSLSFRATVESPRGALAGRLGSVVSSASTMPLPGCVQSSGHLATSNAASWACGVVGGRSGLLVVLLGLLVR